MESKPVEYLWGVHWELPDGTVHREDGPAIEHNNGPKRWLVNGKLHRLDGPAIIYSDLDTEWYINDYPVDDEIHQWANEFNIDLNNLTDEDKQMIALYWSGYGK